MQHQIVNSKVELLGTKENTTVKYSSNFRSADELKTAAEALMAEKVVGNHDVFLLDALSVIAALITGRNKELVSFK